MLLMQVLIHYMHPLNRYVFAAAYVYLHMKLLKFSNGYACPRVLINDIVKQTFPSLIIHQVIVL